ncbi:hypothetical protein QBC42DRAFT_254774 [Cladorrhinum samala]|uniref:Uncharacterized protein n=1 Tax=Cladorrhinum samala TaxID=585594 RepID=A0AAV9HGW2_9PEZI|nr:hypothetical protein QBC42DRAFT_254774 [Cladorrhinum samala]
MLSRVLERRYFGTWTAPREDSLGPRSAFFVLGRNRKPRESGTEAEHFRGQNVPMICNWLEFTICERSPVWFDEKDFETFKKSKRLTGNTSAVPMSSTFLDKELATLGTQHFNLARYFPALLLSAWRCFRDRPYVIVAMAAEAEKVIAPETSAPEVAAPVEKKSDEAVTTEVATESVKAGGTPTEVASTTTVVPNGSEVKDVKTTSEDSKPNMVDPAQSTEVAAPSADTAAEPTAELNGVSAQPVTTGKPASVEEAPEKPEVEPVSVPAPATTSDATADGISGAANGDTREDVQMKEASDDTTAAEVEKTESAVGNGKRKAEDAFGADDDAESKKAKPDTTESATTNGTVPARKPGRPKKERKILTPVGQTARKTRSQGPVEA